MNKYRAVIFYTKSVEVEFEAQSLISAQGIASDILDDYVSGDEESRRGKEVDCYFLHDKGSNGVDDVWMMDDDDQGYGNE